MRVLRATAVAFACALAVSAQARTPVPIMEYRDEPIVTASGKTPTLDGVSQAIVKAAVLENWSLAKAGEAGFVATLVVRAKHTIVFDVAFSTEKFSVTYKDSNNMKYTMVDGVAHFHPNGNVWSRNLVAAIKKQFASM